MADYSAGRRFGNSNGQAGAFGQSTGFGGFGGQAQNTTTGSGFGSNNTSTGGLFGGGNTGGGFGTNNQTTSAFGGFGASKPATSSLFGSTSASNAQPTNSLFGTTGGSAFGQPQTNTGFGAQNNTGGLFGQNNNQAKPATGMFGGSTTTTGGLFQNTNNNTSAFGSTGTGGGLFGQNTNQTNSAFGNAQQTSASNAFGQTATAGGSSFGAFGNNAAKPGGGGLFGNNTNTTSAFGSNFGTNNATNNTTGGLFGSNTNNSTGGGLFGNKPAAGGSLFGNTNNATQNNQAGGLFGGAQSQQQATSNIGGFGNSLGAKPLSLFGGPQNANNSTFGNNSNTQPQQGSLFGGQASQNTLQAPQGLTASVLDPRPFGSVSIFDGLPPPPQQSLGPIATPISSGQKQRKPAPLPQWKLNPTMSPRFVTPQKQGYGFSYSRYNTPSSVASTPGQVGSLGSSLLGGSINRNLGKSYSTSNLRRNFDTDGDSVLAPGAFSASRTTGHSSLKKLTINRNLRNDLFFPIGSNGNTPEKPDPKSSSNLKKSVSFEANLAGDNGATNGTEDTNTNNSRNGNSGATPSAEEQGYLRSSTRVNVFNSKPSSRSERPEMTQVKGNELAIVQEDHTLEPVHSSRHSHGPEENIVLGSYWSRPSIDELKRMSRDQLKSVPDFTVGRENAGYCHFDQPVDLSNVKFDKFWEDYVNISNRTLTVYPDKTLKPPMGSGMNVPSTITLYHCGPLKITERKIASHIEKLRKITDTTFIKLDMSDNAAWTFKVPHFTTYGLDFDDDEDMESEAGNLQSSMLSEALPVSTPNFEVETTPTAHKSGAVSSYSVDEVSEGSDPEDTFDFKTSTRRIPGGFEELAVSDDEPDMAEVQNEKMSFLGQRSAVLQPLTQDEPSESENESLQDEPQTRDDLDVEMAGSFPVADEAPVVPKSILKNSIFNISISRKPRLVLGDDWTEQLQQTISPRKRDRQALKESQALLFRDNDAEVPSLSPLKKQKTQTAHIDTSLDLMNSLFGKENLRKSVGGNKEIVKKGFQVRHPIPIIPNGHTYICI
jgi:nuclear pore complex protein Nup98-Nup96